MTGVQEIRRLVILEKKILLIF